MLKKIVVVFVFAFLLNFIWEHLHSVFYVSYKGGEITNFILLKAALFDATVIALIIFAILLEKWALGTGRWVYTDAMPIIPFLRVGLTPVIQLGLLGYISLRISNFFRD